MSKDVIPLYVADVSAFTKTLRAALSDRDSLPGHATMLTLVAKAAGFQNHQHLKADTSATAPTLDELALKRALRVFDENGLMNRWPKWTKVQGLCLWPFWARLPAHQDISEKQVNEVLKAGLGFDDHVLLRRSLIDHKLATRTIDGRVYRRIEQRPTPEALALMKRLKEC
ncbi:DUF2087 domain-containing protein [Shimia sp. R11_0]|uniref:DUF2087 domain-containing protein n=1 Tax=Shimia sp. R11_0 TaxID=2821096 RepID=UPI001AD95F34|nr:DUF2087 domain-containing protein [Shimia sp. R11_0]MBO9476866.1 DUF2087 domain-containing protein [Shimia sp. R11_0]